MPMTLGFVRTAGREATAAHGVPVCGTVAKTLGLVVNILKACPEAYVALPIFSVPTKLK